MNDEHDPGTPKVASVWTRMRGAAVDVCTIGSFALEIVRLLQILAEVDSSRAAISVIVARLVVNAVHAVLVGSRHTA
ncbi:hypothetical protein [Nocardia jinanensis]|uniref:Uncharacterized protein n=1 Tax=Nocardia jinanensis TaxID=382504 RepID=A0A917RYI3_9NOCA|nr:hypothetical protein [Nocardia jinanensis]GGL44285.1 hypothetical protein GCM10011588_68770 [Nocardia jinanensis]